MLTSHIRKEMRKLLQHRRQTSRSLVVQLFLLFAYKGE